MNESLLEQYESWMLKMNEHPDRDNMTLFNKIDRANDLFFHMDRKGAELEKDGKIDEAIDVYEKMIAYATDHPGPYHRLAVLYRKKKRYIDEVRVLKRAIYVYEKVVFVYRADRISKLNQFKERLEKAQSLVPDPPPKTLWEKVKGLLTNKIND